MAGIPVRQSASKEEFLRALGLNEADNQDRWKLRVMWEEVVNYWVTHFETPSRAILKPEYASNAGVQPPYKWAHLSPTTVDAAIAEIWGNGGQWPRHFYDMGYSKDRKVYNWVLKWLLWHVCRYRDWRNRRARNGSGTAITNNETAVPRAADADTSTMPPHDYWTTVMN